MEKPDESLLNRVQQIPATEIMRFVRNAQRRKVTKFTGFEVKNKNLHRFHVAISDLYVRGDTHARSFIDRMAPHNEDDPSNSPHDSGDSDTSLFDMATQADSYRGQLLETMKDLVATLRSQSDELRALRERMGKVETGLLDLKSQGTKEDSLNPEYINYLSELLREVRGLQKGLLLNEGDQ